MYKLLRKMISKVPIKNYLIQRLYFSFSAMNSVNASLTMAWEVRRRKNSEKMIFFKNEETKWNKNVLNFIAILEVYFTDKLGYDKDTATILYHTFIVTVYFTCIIGAIISDNWLGKFKTILYLSLVYAAGNAVVALGAVPVLHIPV